MFQPSLLAAPLRASLLCQVPGVFVHPLSCGLACRTDLPASLTGRRPWVQVKVGVFSQEEAEECINITFNPIRAGECKVPLAAQDHASLCTHRRVHSAGVLHICRWHLLYIVSPGMCAKVQRFLHPLCRV